MRAVTRTATEIFVTVLINTVESLQRCCMPRQSNPSKLKINSQIILLQVQFTHSSLECGFISQLELSGCSKFRTSVAHKTCILVGVHLWQTSLECHLSKSLKLFSNLQWCPSLRWHLNWNNFRAVNLRNLWYRLQLIREQVEICKEFFHEITCQINAVTLERSNSGAHQGQGATVDVGWTVHCNWSLYFKITNCICTITYRRSCGAPTKVMKSTIKKTWIASTLSTEIAARPGFIDRQSSG